ncbi:hypothetical protein GGX14DRAFT_465218 [Mycena pura]|uniref:Uncharacterized protein n=1 Tax=Mycena pura TaxID=153505 RepID=A0AAD6VAA0_9AGAR|nr:hypothetical protein GGX14DRAFT_465218 [Mycena pura]
MAFKLNIIYLLAFSTLVTTGALGQTCGTIRVGCGTPDDPLCCAGLFCSGSLDGIGTCQPCSGVRAACGTGESPCCAGLSCVGSFGIGTCQ